MKKDTFWNLPNCLTVLRIALVPVMVALLWWDPNQAGEPERWLCIVTMTIFVGAMITDIVDGYLARKWGLESVAGAFLDPHGGHRSHHVCPSQLAAGLACGLTGLPRAYDYRTAHHCRRGRLGSLC